MSTDNLHENGAGENPAKGGRMPNRGPESIVPGWMRRAVAGLGVAATLAACGDAGANQQPLQTPDSSGTGARSTEVGTTLSELERAEQETYNAIIKEMETLEKTPGIVRYVQSENDVLLYHEHVQTEYAIAKKLMANDFTPFIIVIQGDDASIDSAPRQLFVFGVGPNNDEGKPTMSYHYSAVFTGEDPLYSPVYAGTNAPLMKFVQMDANGQKTGAVCWALTDPSQRIAQELVCVDQRVVSAFVLGPDGSFEQVVQMPNVSNGDTVAQMAQNLRDFLWEANPFQVDIALAAPISTEESVPTKVPLKTATPTVAPSKEPSKPVTAAPSKEAPKPTESVNALAIAVSLGFSDKLTYIYGDDGSIYIVTAQKEYELARKNTSDQGEWQIVSEGLVIADDHFAQVAADIIAVSPGAKIVGYENGVVTIEQNDQAIFLRVMNGEDIIQYEAPVDEKWLPVTITINNGGHAQVFDQSGNEIGFSEDGWIEVIRYAGETITNTDIITKLNNTLPVTFYDLNANGAVVETDMAALASGSNLIFTADERRVYVYAKGGKAALGYAEIPFDAEYTGTLEQYILEGKELDWFVETDRATGEVLTFVFESEMGESTYRGVYEDTITPGDDYAVMKIVLVKVNESARLTREFTPLDYVNTDPQYRKSVLSSLAKQDEQKKNIENVLQDRETGIEQLEASILLVAVESFHKKGQLIDGQVATAQLIIEKLKRGESVITPDGIDLSQPIVMRWTLDEVAMRAGNDLTHQIIDGQLIIRMCPWLPESDTTYGPFNGADWTSNLNIILRNILGRLSPKDPATADLFYRLMEVVTNDVADLNDQGLITSWTANASVTTVVIEKK